MQQPRAIVIGAGIGGLATSIRLATQGWDVQVFEAADKPGGKIAEWRSQGYRFDLGPSLFTLPEAVDDLFRLAGEVPEAHFRYRQLPVITRYFFPDGTNLPAWKDADDFAREVARQTLEPAAHVQAHLRQAETVYDITNHVFLERSLHKLSTYLRWPTVKSLFRFHQIDAFRSLHAANEAAFLDPRLVQLFDRYATYNGSDPYQAPATLNVISHLEHNMGAYFPEGGMYSIAASLHALAERVGVKFAFQAPVEQILVQKKVVTGVQVNGEAVAAEVVVSNADVVPTFRKLLPGIVPPEKTLNQPRSSSALIFYWGINRIFPGLDTHNIFFSKDYKAEFQALWEEKTLADDVTVYVYISSKAEPGDAPEGCENWFVMVNAPANTGQDWDALRDKTRKAILQKLSLRLQVELDAHIVTEQVLDPRGIEVRTSSYQGALYGSSSNNKFAAFLRHPNFSSKVKGLYFVGGSVHPGGGIPLCLLSARIACDLIGRAK